MEFSKNFSDFIYAESLFNDPLQPKSIFCRMKALAEGLGAITDAEKAKCLGVSKSSYSGWASGHQKPALIHFIETCTNLSISPTRLFSEDFIRESASSVPKKQTRSIFWKRSPNRARVIDKAPLLLKAVEAFNADNSRGVGAIAKLVGMERNHFRRTLPGFAEAINKESRETRRRLRPLHEEMLIQEANEIVDRMVTAGCKPTISRISKAMRKPGAILNLNLRLHLKHKLASLEKAA